MMQYDDTETTSAQKMGSGPDETESRSLGTSQKQRGPSVITRRFIGMGLMLAMAYAIFHVVFLTDLLDPLLTYVDPIKAGIAWVIEDPKRAWVALAAVIIPHIGLYYMIFEDRR